jgi:hypothetical protein
MSILLYYSPFLRSANIEGVQQSSLYPIHLLTSESHISGPFFIRLLSRPDQSANRRYSKAVKAAVPWGNKFVCIQLQNE